MPTRLQFQATGVALSTRVAGISLALRHARVAERAGVGEVVLVAGSANEEEAIRRSLVRSGGAPKIPVRIVQEAEPEVDTLEGSAIYLPKNLQEERPTPAYSVATMSDRKSAERFLFAQIRKSIALDGIIAFYFMRPLARLFTRALLGTRVSPNQATLGALAFGIGAAVSAGYGGHRGAVLAGIFYWMGGVIDCVDGELARLRLQSSKIGEWLDSMVDEASTVLLVLGLGVGLWRDGYGSNWPLIAGLGCLFAALALVPMYRDLHRMGLSIDTAQYPWFFGNESASNSEGPTGFFGRFVNGLGYLIRRDANITGTAILLALNLRRISLGIIVGAYVAALALLIVHKLVMSTRRPEATETLP